MAFGPGGAVTSSAAYGYEAGRLKSLGFDLAGAASDQNLVFGYNPASQIASRTSANPAYAAAAASLSRGYAANGLNQYQVIDGVAHQYDPNGNLVFDGSTSFAYDAENRLISASGARNATLDYDPLGRLWQVSGPSGTTRFHYDGDRLLEEYDWWGNRLRGYAHGAGSDEPLIWYELTGGPIRRNLFADHQGSIAAAADDGGNAVARNAYDAWGVPNAGNAGRFGYTGQAWIPELGMYYYKARIYAPALGRFLQTDPVGYKDQMNLYAYVGNDPVNFTDPLGLARICTTATATGSNVAQTKCVDVDGNRNGKSRENDMSARDMARVRRSYGEFIRRFGASPNGQVPNLASYHKQYGGDGSDAEKNTVSVATQFWGFAASRISEMRAVWGQISKINVNSGPSPEASAAAFYNYRDRSITFTGRGLSGRLMTPIYSESYSDIGRILIHEIMHGFGREMDHFYLDHIARSSWENLEWAARVVRPLTDSQDVE